MLSRRLARGLIAPSNALARVKHAVRSQDGFVSRQLCGAGVACGIGYFLERSALHHGYDNIEGSGDGLEFCRSEKPGSGFARIR